MIDIKGAFDLVWWPIIASRLRLLELSKNSQEILGSYLSERLVILENDGEEVCREMNKGCSQGSVLGPLLWNLTFDELMEKELPEKNKDDCIFGPCHIPH